MHYLNQAFFGFIGTIHAQTQSSPKKNTKNVCFFFGRIKRTQNRAALTLASKLEELIEKLDKRSAHQPKSLPPKADGEPPAEEAAQQPAEQATQQETAVTDDPYLPEVVDPVEIPVVSGARMLGSKPCVRPSCLVKGGGFRPQGPYGAFAWNPADMPQQLTGNHMEASRQLLMHQLHMDRMQKQMSAYYNIQRLNL